MRKRWEGTGPFQTLTILRDLSPLRSTKMRELLFKELTSQVGQRKILSVTETMSRDGIEVTTQRRCLYKLKDRIRVNNLPGGSDFKKFKDDKQFKNRHFYAIRRADCKNGDKLLCKVNGSLFVVMGDYLYLIGFTNSIKVSFKKLE